MWEVTSSSKEFLCICFPVDLLEGKVTWLLLIESIGTDLTFNGNASLFPIWSAGSGSHPPCPCRSHRSPASRVFRQIRAGHGCDLEGLSWQLSLHRLCGRGDDGEAREREGDVFFLREDGPWPLADGRRNWKSWKRTQNRREKRPIGTFCSESEIHKVWVTLEFWLSVWCLLVQFELSVQVIDSLCFACIISNIGLLITI